MDTPRSSSSPRDTASRWRWAAPVAVMAGILAATSWPTPPHMPGSSDKLVHFSAYALLGVTMAWAAQARSIREAFAWILLVSALGAADEWHQQFIPGRRMDARDWLADTAGAVSGFSLVTALRRRRESVA
jgi:VanZ family protein